jgi:[ribosomal protein S5]-alanine N-acetyltransferase
MPSLLGPEPFVQPLLETERLRLEPVEESHAAELHGFFSDQELHRFVPYEPLTLEAQKQKCARWATRRSPDGKELWLNWAGRRKDSGALAGHFQVGVSEDGIASVGYVVGRAHQNLGLATEAMLAVFSYLERDLAIREVKAWSDSRNLASHRLAQKLGMRFVEKIPGADFFKGEPSDEHVFSRRLL